jgi:hypothetical protein
MDEPIARSNRLAYRSDSGRARRSAAPAESNGETSRLIV